MFVKPLSAKLRSALKRPTADLAIGITTATIACCLSSALARPAWTARPPQSHSGRLATTTLVSGDRGKDLSQSAGVDRQGNGLYTAEQIDYFLEIALGSEFGDADAAVRKWNGSVRIRVNGMPTGEDLRSLNAVIQDINGLAPGIHLQVDDQNPNVELHFAPESQFSRIEPHYQPVNLGYFWTEWHQDVLNHATVLISTTGITQTERSHLIREELTQSLGLMRDSDRYPDSLFYQGWTEPTQFAPIDQVLIQMLYRPEVQAGMTRSQVVNALRAIPSAARSAPLILNPSNGKPLDFSLGQPSSSIHGTGEIGGTRFAL